MSASTSVSRASTASRTRIKDNATVGRVILRGAFYLLLFVIAVYTLFPFYWAVRSSLTCLTANRTSRSR